MYLKQPSQFKREEETRRDNIRAAFILGAIALALMTFNIILIANQF